MIEGNWKALFVGADGEPCLRFACSQCRQEFRWGGNELVLAKVQHCGTVESAPPSLIDYLKPRLNLSVPLPTGPPLGDQNPWTSGGMLRHATALNPNPAPIPLPCPPDDKPRSGRRRLFDTWRGEIL